MDKIEMCNKVINAIDVMNRIQGQTVEMLDVSVCWELGGAVKYILGDVTVVKNKRGVKLFIKDIDVTGKTDNVNVIYKLIYGIYEKQQKKFEELAFKETVDYLNSFVGK